MKGTLWRREYLAYKKQASPWLLVYGRRKTGKTFLVKLLEKPDLYITITRDLTAITEYSQGDLQLHDMEYAMKQAHKRLRRGETIVIDEFQRLPVKYWQLLSLAHPHGRLVLVASSLTIVNKVLEEGSPLLGLLTPLRIDILHVADVMASLAARTSPYNAILWSPLLMEPWLFPIVSEDLLMHQPPWRFIAENIEGLAEIASGLIGEVFEEEERQLTRLYRAVLLLLGRGIWKSDEIAGLLYKRGLLATSSPGPVAAILDRMTGMGLVEKLKLWKTRRYRIYYKHKSPLLGILYGLMSRLGAGDSPVPFHLAERVALELYARELQFTLGMLLAEAHGGVQAYTIFPGNMGDIDVVVLDGRARKPLWGYEVKMGECDRRDFDVARKRMEDVGIGGMGLVCLRGVSGVVGGYGRVFGPEDLVGLAVGVIKQISY